jgi:hypothetical protein
MRRSTTAPKGGNRWTHFRESLADIRPLLKPHIVHITLEQRDDEDGFLRRSLELRKDGALVLSGHDLGRGVADVVGSGLTEYEFVRTIDAAGVHQLCDAMGLNGPTDLAAAVEGRFTCPGGSRSFEQFLADNGVPSEFWNRVGT